MYLLQISLEQTITLGQALGLTGSAIGFIIWLIKIVTKMKTELEQVKKDYVEIKKDLDSHKDKSDEKFEKFITHLEQDRKDMNKQYFHIMEKLTKIEVTLAGKQDIIQKHA
jgi:uncharacterized membrane-anchored protein YhcB (DUF1043 family)